MKIPKFNRKKVGLALFAAATAALVALGVSPGVIDALATLFGAAAGSIA